MNERIWELWNQATLDPANEDSKDLILRFAELIVRECVKVMYDNAIERNVPPDIDKTPTKYAIAILKHFGVE